jgi:pimeloyl-ACP methyl ester carboxylesterase
MTELIHADVAAPDAPRLAYSQAGAGRDVVLLHGALSSREDMILALFPTLAERFRVTAFDRPGHGDSERVGVTGSCWRQAQAAWAASQALGLERPIVVGHSYGGAVALAWAMQYPAAVAGVVALAPITFPELRLEHFVFGPRGAPLAGPMLNRALAASLDPVLLPILWRAMFLPQAMPEKFATLFPFEKAARTGQTQAEGEDANLLNAGLVRNAINYPSTRTPVRILAGDRDLVVNNMLHGRVLAQIMPDASFETAPGLGHMVHHFAQPRIADLVKGLAARA